VSARMVVKDSLCGCFDLQSLPAEYFSLSSENSSSTSIISFALPAFTSRNDHPGSLSEAPLTLSHIVYLLNPIVGRMTAAGNIRSYPLIPIKPCAWKRHIQFSDYASTTHEIRVFFAHGRTGSVIPSRCHAIIATSNIQKKRHTNDQALFFIDKSCCIPFYQLIRGADMLKGLSVQFVPKAFSTLVLLTAVLTSMMVLGISPDAWSESALIHNSNRFGTCSNAAFSGTSKTICETNGGVWTPSTKWSGSWGVPAGHYGEFVCETCHERGSDNIKNIISHVTAPSSSFPGSTINFLSTTAPSGFGDDTGGHASSSKICEVCHSTTLYHRYNTAGQSVLDHNNNSDCVLCHTHGKGFKAGCDSCHGNPPIASVPNASSPGGNTGLADSPYATGSLHAGAQNKHVSKFGYANCSICHNGYSMPSSASTYTIDINFSFNGSTTGTYDGQTGVRYNAPNTATGSMTCSNVYCHSSGTSVSTGIIPAGTSPSWVTAGPLACNTCHGYPPQYDQDQPKSNSHVVHQQQLAQHAWFSCATCHAETTGDGAVTAMHVNGEFNVSPAAGNRFAYTYARGGGTCSNITCHPEANYHNGGSRVWGNIVLQADISVSYGPGPFQVTLVGSVSGGTQPYTFHWEFDDGSTADGNVVTHTYTSSGPYYPRLTVTDAKFHTGSRTTQVNPSSGNILPVADKSISVANRTITVTDRSYDPDYNLYGHSGDGMINISWGDGTPAQVQSIALTGSPSNVQFTHTYAANGTYTITHAITDNAGGGPVASPNVSVTVPAPLAITGRVTHSNTAPYPGIQLDLRRVSNNAHIAYATTNTNGDYSFTISSSLVQFCPFKLVPPTIPGVTFAPSHTNICTSISNADITATP